MAMQAIDEYEYDRTLILPPADVYAVNDLLEWLTISSVNCDHPRGTPIGILTKFRQPARNDEKCNCTPAAQNANARPRSEPDATDQEVGSTSGEGIGRSAIGHPILASAVKVGDMLLAFESSERICDQCQIAGEEYRDYLFRRLHEAAIAGKFELWDILRRQVLPPPENEDGDDTPTPETSKSEPSLDLVELINRLFERYSRLLVVRVDLKYRQEFASMIPLEAVQHHRDVLFHDCRHVQSVFGNLVGYAWGLEYGEGKCQ